MKKVFIYSATKLGCFARYWDHKIIEEFFKLNGWKLIKDPKQADLIFVNTCAFEKETEDFSIEEIKRLLQIKHKNCSLVVGGCLSEINEKRLSRIFKGLTLSPKSMHKLNNYINAKVKIDDINISLDTPSEFCIDICRGCLGECTYCKIKNSIGSVKSTPLEQIIKQFKMGIEKGYKKLRLIGDDVGCYGADMNTDLSILIKRLAEEKKLFRLRIAQAAPERLIPLLPGIKPYVKSGLIDFIYLPVQSGSNRILKLMGRKYTTEQIRDFISELVMLNPNITFKTDFIVGFPQETEEDFRRSLELLIDFRNNFVVVNIFVFDGKDGTQAADM